MYLAYMSLSQAGSHTRSGVLSDLVLFLAEILSPQVYLRGKKDMSVFVVLFIPVARLLNPSSKEYSMVCRGGQVSMEFLLITGFAFLLILPIVIIAYNQSATFNDEVSAAQIQKVGNQIAEAVNTVYYAGPPTKKTIKVWMPDNVYDVDITDQTLTFTVQGSGGQYEYSVFSDTNMTGSIQTFNGVHVLSIQAETNVVNITES